MPDNTTNVGEPLRGMNTDVHPMNLGENGYDFALNAVVEEFSGNGFPLLQNEASNLPFVVFPTGYQVIGFVNVLEQTRIIVFLVNPTTGASEIGEIHGLGDCGKELGDGTLTAKCDDCGFEYIPEQSELTALKVANCATYTTIVNDSCLNFDVSFPIRFIEYKITPCSIQLYFTDNTNPRRWIEFNYVNNDETQPLTVAPFFLQIIGFEPPPCNDPIYGTGLDCNALNIQPDITTACITVEGITSGGQLRAGVYQFFVCMSDALGNILTSWLSPTNPTPIFTQEITTLTNYQTSLAIRLAIQNLDPLGAFRYYNLAVAKTIDNVTSFFLVQTLPVEQTTFTYTGDGTNEIPLTAAQIFTKYPYYETADTVAQSGGIMFWGNLKQAIRPNLQRVANNINLFWQTIAIPESIYNDPLNFQKFRGYMRDEVYPFGIVFIYNTGEESNAYHIPGRVSTSEDFEIINNNDAIEETKCIDCSGTTVDAQIFVTDINDSSCIVAPSGIVLNPNNAQQAASCPLTPYTSTPCSTVGLNPPTVNAGPDQTINYVGLVSLNGTVTTSGGATVVSSAWAQLSGPNEVTIANPGVLNTTFQGINTGTYVFQLCVLDSGGGIGHDEVTYTVNVPPNTPPIADPGGDQLITLPTTTGALNGSGSSDPDGSIAFYQWNQLSGPNTALIASPNAVYSNLSGLVEGTYQFQLIVTDNRDCSSSGACFVYVVANPCDSVPTCAQLMYPINGSVTLAASVVSLQWSATSCATSYEVFLKKSTDGSYTDMGNTTLTSFNVTNLDENVVYDWYVVPMNTAGSATGCDACFYSFATPAGGGNQPCTRQRWQVYNTASVTGTPHDVYDGCTESCWEYGEMAYWESTETYPTQTYPNFDIWGDLCGEPIRHHKFPDSIVTHIHDNENGAPSYTTSNTVYVIGVKVDHDSIVSSIAAAVSGGLITQADANRIVGYRIVRGNRYNNKSVQAKGIMYDVNAYQRKNGGTNFDLDPIYFSNYPFNDLRDNPFITDNFDNYKTHNDPVGPNLPFINTNRYTFHSPDTHFNQVLPGTILKLESAEYGQAEGYYNYSDLQAKQRFLSNTAYAIAFTGGIIAAMLGFTDKSTKSYTVKGSVISGLGIASGELGPWLPYQAGAGAAIVPESIVDTSLNLPFVSSINSATEVTTTTTQGKITDFLNPLYLAFYKPELLPVYPFILENFLSTFLSNVLQEANIILNLIESLTPYRDWCVQYQGVGNYNAYKPVANDTGNKIRQINSYFYLSPDNLFINESSVSSPGTNAFIRYNNFQRESSLYLRYAGATLPDAGATSGVVDTSRTTLGSSPYNCNLNQKQYSDISSYYASIKNYVPDQYGTVYNIEYLPTGSCSYAIGTSNSICQGVYGGDTVIGRFALKVKVPYFLSNTFRLPEGTDFAYDLVPNLAIPRNYYDNTAGVGTNFNNIGDLLSIFTPSGMATLLGRPKSIRDCSTDKFFYQNGYIYLFHYGIPYYLVESDYNTYYRYGINNLEGDFYPNQQDLNFWLQEENVPIKQDNTYYYNNSYSKQNKETSISIDPATFQPGIECRVTYPTRIIYSDPGNFLTYRANNFYDYPITDGELTSLEGIENETLLIRTDDTTKIIRTILRIPVDNQTIQVGNAALFSNPPQDIATTTLGYTGSQHVAIIHTEYGHIWVDAKRGAVFNLGPNANGLEEISNNGMKNWFRQNLPFQLAKDFPTMTNDDLDNAFNHIGLILGFDKRFNRFILSKLDYKVTDPNVFWNSDTKNFYVPSGMTDIVVSVTNNKYFCNKSWTISYNFFTKSWVSYHSYIPNYFIESFDWWLSGINGVDSTAWIHNKTNKSYQVFGGKMYPFTVQTITKPSIDKNNLNSIQWSLDAIRYHNEYDPYYATDITFNKAVIFTQWQNSGYLELQYNDKKNLQNLLQYPVTGVGHTKIRVTNADGIWRINTFYDIVTNRLNNIPLWLNNCANSEKHLNQLALDYQMPDLNKRRIRGEYCRVKLTNDKHSNYKMIFKWIVNDSVKTYR